MRHLLLFIPSGISFGVSIGHTCSKHVQQLHLAARGRARKRYRREEYWYCCLVAGLREDGATKNESTKDDGSTLGAYAIRNVYSLQRRAARQMTKWCVKISVAPKQLSPTKEIVCTEALACTNDIAFTWPSWPSLFSQGI